MTTSHRESECGSAGSGDGDHARWLKSSADRADKTLHTINTHSGEL